MRLLTMTPAARVSPLTDAECHACAHCTPSTMSPTAHCRSLDLPVQRDWFCKDWTPSAAAQAERREPIAVGA